MTRDMDTVKMSHEEMIDTLKGLVFGTFDRTTVKEREALNMVIEELQAEQKSCGDATDTKSCGDATDTNVRNKADGMTKEPTAYRRYRDLLEYFGNDLILEDDEEFKKWLERIKWHVRKANELYQKYERQKEHCEDSISREDVIKAIDRHTFDTDDGLCLDEDISIILEEVAPKQEFCEDCVSRKSLIYKLQERHDFFVDAYGGFINLPQKDKARVDAITNCIAMVVNEPPVKSARKKGKWTNGDPICPCCGEDKFKDLDADIWADWQPKYCPNCGSLMEVEA